MLHRGLKARVDMDNFYFFLFFFVSLPWITAAAGTVSSRCEAASSETKYTLHCQFPVNVNTTRRDFSLFFDAGDGKADRFLDCRWPDGSYFYCFNLEGVTCLQPVSSEAYVTVPERIACSSGRFSAKILGSVDARDTVCRYVSSPDDQVNLKPPPTDPPETSPKEATSSSTVIAIVVPVLIGVLLTVAAVFVVIKRKKIKRRLKQLTSGKQQEQPDERGYSSVPANDRPDV